MTISGTNSLATKIEVEEEVVRDEDDDDRCRRESCEFRLLKLREIVLSQFMGTNQVVVSRHPVPGYDSSLLSRRSRRRVFLSLSSDSNAS